MPSFSSVVGVLLSIAGGWAFHCIARRLFGRRLEAGCLSAAQGWLDILILLIALLIPVRAPYQSTARTHRQRSGSLLFVTSRGKIADASCLYQLVTPYG